MARDSSNARIARPDTLHGTLRRAALWHPSKSLTCIRGPRDASTVTYAALLTEAQAVAAWLMTNGVRPGEAVVLSFARTERFVRAFWGCLFAGAIPVPLPDVAAAVKPGAARERIESVCRRLDDPLMLVDDRGSSVSSTRHLVLPAELPYAARIDLPEPSPSDVALIQFSSGSTGSPRGVVLTHENILANLRGIQSAIQVEPHDVGVSWTPLHHDLALVGFLLGSIHCPNDLVLIETSAFVRRPRLWLDALREHRGTITAAPNFGQSLVMSRLADDEAWDLSSVRILFNGAEPITPHVMRRFMTTFARHGLCPEAMFPVYGLAEASLAVSLSTPGAPPRVERFDRAALSVGNAVVRVAPDDPRGVEIVSEGRTVEGSELRFVDDHDIPLADDIVGHVQVRGASVTTGYYRDEEATGTAFCDGWLRTGDLGFLHAGDLFITGRSKDVLFLNGQNVYSTDIEQIASRAPGLQERLMAATAWRAPGDVSDRLLLFVGTTRSDDNESALAGIRQALQSSLGLTPEAIVPIPASQFPRTTSGKLQRQVMRERFERGEYREAMERAARRVDRTPMTRRPAMAVTATQRAVHAIWVRELGLTDEELGIHDVFEQVGGTSLNAVTILSQLEDRFGVPFAFGTLTEHSTIAALAAYIDQLKEHGPPPIGRSVVFKG